MEGSRSEQIITFPDPGGPKTYGSGSGSGKYTDRKREEEYMENGQSEYLKDRTERLVRGRKLY
jgi:hypothetical protein